jgi:hypothetical protein
MGASTSPEIPALAMCCDMRKTAVSNRPTRTLAEALRLEHAGSVLAAESFLVVDAHAALGRIESEKIALSAEPCLISDAGAFDLDYVGTELADK